MGDWSPTGGGRDIKVDTDGVMGFAKNVGSEMSTFNLNITGGVNPFISTAMSAVGRSDIDSAVFFQQQHTKYFEAAMLLVQDAQKGLMALQQGGFTVAATYLNKDAESAAKVSDVTDAFDPPKGRTSLDDLLAQESKKDKSQPLPADKDLQDRIDQITADNGEPTDPSGQSDNPGNPREQDKTIDTGGGTTYNLPFDDEGVENRGEFDRTVQNPKDFRETWTGRDEDVPYYGIDPGPPTTAI